MRKISKVFFSGKKLLWKSVDNFSKFLPLFIVEIKCGNFPRGRKTYNKKNIKMEIVWTKTKKGTFYCAE